MIVPCPTPCKLRLNKFRGKWQNYQLFQKYFQLLIYPGLPWTRSWAATSHIWQGSPADATILHVWSAGSDPVSVPGHSLEVQAVLLLHQPPTWTWTCNSAKAREQWPRPGPCRYRELYRTHSGYRGMDSVHWTVLFYNWSIWAQCVHHCLAHSFLYH